MAFEEGIPDTRVHRTQLCFRERLSPDNSVAVVDKWSRCSQKLIGARCSTLGGPESSFALDAAPYHAVDETIGGSEASNALSMLETLKAR